MTAAIATKKVIGRRDLHFSSLDDILADLNYLAQAKEVRSLGNWSPGQNLRHLAVVMNTAIDGIPPMLPGIARFFIRLFFKRRFLSKPMPPGFQLPAKAAKLLPPPTSWEEGLQSYRQAIHRLQTDTHREPSAFLGRLTVEEWNQLQCRHAELHLSFLVPAPAPEQ